MDYDEIIGRLGALSIPENVAGMARFGINAHNTLGIPVVKLRELARSIGRDHGLAARLFAAGIHESRILASMVDEPRLVTEMQMEEWVSAFDSWDVCDGCCNNLFVKTGFAEQKALQWSARPEEFVKRAGFVLMAVLAVHHKESPEALFRSFLVAVKRGAADERNFVKKAVNWALRQIGKRSMGLNILAVALAGELAESSARTARWIGRNAMKELESESVQRRLARKDPL